MRSLLILLGIMALSGASMPVHAANALQLDSDIFVERETINADGSRTKLLEEPKKVVPGDRLVFVVKFKNTSASTASNFTVTNPLPAAVQFESTSDGQENVSVDGGKSWGRLAQLRVAEAGGALRPAAAADVTHLQWNLSDPLTAGAEGKLIFRGVVR
nr:hypothetical protein [uncultured Sphingorhabdus sp.]